MRNCQNCYYCTDTKRIGGSWWCICSNPARSAESGFKGRNWGRARLNLPCWREDKAIEAPVSTNKTSSPEESKKDGAEIRLARKRSHFMQLYLDGQLDLAVPWRHVVYSKIAGLRNKDGK